MKNAIIVALAVVCAAVILSSGGLDAQSENAATHSLNLTGSLVLFDQPNRHVIGTTTTTFPPWEPFSGPTRLVVNRVCFAEFPDTSVCVFDEVLNSIPPPPPWQDRVIVIGNPLITCMDSDGGFQSGLGVCPIESPVMCCGF